MLRSWSFIRVVFVSLLLIFFAFLLPYFSVHYKSPSLTLTEATSDASENIFIYARGLTGEEKIALHINGKPLEFWSLTTDIAEYVYVPTEAISIDTLSIDFINDRWEPEQEINYDVQIDYIIVNGDRYDSEHASTFSTGTWQESSWCAPGKKSSEWLHCGGNFTYNVPSGTVVGGGGAVEKSACSDGVDNDQDSFIDLSDPDCDDANDTSEESQNSTISRTVTVKALGALGSEEIALAIGGEELVTWTLTTEFKDYTYVLKDGLSHDFIDILFTSIGDAAEDVRIDYIRVDDALYQADDTSVLSKGSWDPGSACAEGYKQSEWIHCQGGWMRFNVSQSHWQCGNTVEEKGEECDDGNVVDGDGCSAICLKEEGRPDIPQDFQVISTTESTITLEWMRDAVTGYNIKRDGEYLTTVEETSEHVVGDKIVFEDDTVEEGAIHTYQITSFLGDLFSTATDVVRARAATPDPSTVPIDRSYLPTDIGSEYEIAFFDEFNGQYLDINKWNSSFIWGPGLIINNEEQYYIDRLSGDYSLGVNPFSFTGENLVITADRTPGTFLDDVDGQEYTSGIITSRDAFNFTHGYAEARVKIPKGKGLWPAFWLLNTYYVDKRPEIDIMENLGHEVGKVHQTYHYYNESHQLISQESTVSEEIYSDDFHVYSVLWEPGLIQYYVDGVPHNRIEGDGVASQDMYILANLAVGGNWPGSPDTSTIFPAEYEIDYIRVYRK